jgi:cell wall-associated NlpC family hydrolase
MRLPTLTARTRTALAWLLALLAVSCLLVTTPAHATPAPTPPDTLASVTAKLTAFARQNEALSEQLNLASAEVTAKQAAAATAEAAAASAAATYATTRARTVAGLVEQYETSSSFSHLGALLLSSSGKDYLQKIEELDQIDASRGQQLSQLIAARSAADTAQTQAGDLLTQARATQAALNRQQTALKADQQKYEALLATLTVAQKQVFTTANTVPVAQAAATITVHASTVGAQAAIAYARAQVGKAYAFAGTGPQAFDCSGLTMMAYRQAGIVLPHNAAEQYGYGTHVTFAELQPGDLIFLYSPISHVELYVGDGLAVSAADEAEGVVYAKVADDMKDWAGATRLS